MDQNKNSRIRVASFDLQPGRKITQKYQILSRLGAGWEGEVYKIREIRTGVERAAKLFYPQRNIGNKTSKSYAQKLHKLRHCSMLIQYHTEEVITFQKMPIVVMISEYVEGELLSEFLKNYPGKRLHPYQAVHLLYALTLGIEEIHLFNEYHGDLHSDNILVNKYGLHFELKLVDLYKLPSSKKDNMKNDICELIRIFYECLGGERWYARHPWTIRNICCGLKRSLILKKFRTISRLREHLEALDWADDYL